jgi:hypothetical protein
MTLDRPKHKEPRKLFFKHIARKIFLEDWAIKLTALIITLGLWLGVTGLSTPTTKRFTIPLNLNVPNNAEVTTAQQDVEIVVSGDKRKVDQINKADLIASVDLTDVATGDRVVTLMPENVAVTLPQGVKLVEVLPIRFLINLEAIEEKDIEVKARTQGNPAPGFEVYNTLISPQKIRVRGPASFVSTLEFVETAIVDLSGKKEEFTARQTPVSVANPKAAVLNTVVDVYFRIGEKRVERAFTLPIPGAPGNTISFVVYGPRSALTKLKADAIEVGWANGKMIGYQDPEIFLPTELQVVAEIRKVKSTLKTGE